MRRNMRSPISGLGGITLFVFMALGMLVAPAIAADAQLVAVAATPSGDGVLTVPVGGAAAFAFAMVNYGAQTVRLFPHVTLPDGMRLLSVCQTDPTNGRCVPSPFGLLGAPAGQVATGSVFLQATGTVPLSAHRRAVLTFTEAYITSRCCADGDAYTAVSVAVQVTP